MTRLSKRGIVEGRPKKFTDPKKMEEKINDFFDWCDSQVKILSDDKGKTRIVYEPYTVSGLCLHLDIDRTTLAEYEQQPEFSTAIKRAKARVENWIEKRSLTGELNPTVSIFNLKNNFGWKDKTEVETTDKTQESYEAWLRKHQDEMKDVTPANKMIE